jgi:AbrB family looped-hinge helix DNA binding protein
MPAEARAKLTTRGRVTLPKAVREQLGWRPGDQLSLEDTDRGVLIRRASDRRLDEAKA